MQLTRREKLGTLENAKNPEAQTMGMGKGANMTFWQGAGE